MNSEQLRLFINGAFGNEADARKVRAALAPYLRQTFDEIRSLIDLLPDESLARQREWRALLATIEEKLLPYNDAFAIELSRQLAFVRCCRGRGDNADAQISGAANCWVGSA